MPTYCVAWGCTNKFQPRSFTFHRFPRDKEMRKKWELAVKRQGFTANNNSRLCSVHFQPSDFDRTGQTVRIKKGAIPSIFSFPPHLQKHAPIRKTRTSQNARQSPAAGCAQPVEEIDNVSSNTISCDHAYVLPASPTALKRKFCEMRSRVETLEQRLKNVGKREKRAKATVQDLLDKLKDKELISDDLEAKLAFYSDFPTELVTKSRRKYSKEQREFALTLHLHGPKAYDYLRKSFCRNLPHPHTLRRWMMSVDARPGLNRMMLEMLKKKRDEDPSTYGSVNMVLDAMAIKQHIQFNHKTQKMSGYVDLGDGGEETDVATEALVFMVVGVKGHWKAPIAYFLTRVLSPETQKILVLHALEALQDCGIKVICITMDGHATNISMCTQLGCVLTMKNNQPLKTYFSHPITGEKIFIIMDACHMLKLARNMLQTYSPIRSPAGLICWSHIKNLNDMQVKDGLLLANKLTSRHIQFHSQKMKVSLAAQTLSNSVAIALQTLRDLKYPLFQNCGATAEYIETTDKLFDVLNSRNLHCKGFRSPLSTRNWTERVEFLMQTKEYLLKLLMNDGSPLHKSKRYLSVLGFVINIDTLLAMIPELLQQQQYVCTYKFSQDHLELLFNSIRASGGWNNNPSASQFHDIFRRIMVKCGATPSVKGNVMVEYETESLSIDALSTRSTDGGEDIESPFVNLHAYIADHMYQQTHFGSLVDNALIYISGFVVRKVLKRLSCIICRGSLVTQAASTSLDQSYHLLELKNEGGLVIPSAGTVKVVRAAERHIRQYPSDSGINATLLNKLVRAEIGLEDIFLLKEHIQDTQDGIDNHHFDLLTSIVNVFHKLRMYHIARSRTIQLQILSNRKRLSKAILFQGF